MNKKKKIAVVYCGQPRLIDIGFAQHAKYLISEDFDVDVYAHLWNILPASDNKIYENTENIGEHDGKYFYIDYFDKSEYKILRQRGEYAKDAVVDSDAIINKFFAVGKELNIKQVIVEDFRSMIEPMFIEFFKRLQTLGPEKYSLIVHSGMLGIYHNFQIAIGQYLSFARAIDMIPNIEEYDGIYKLRTDLIYNIDEPITIDAFHKTFDFNDATYGEETSDKIMIMPNIEMAFNRIAHLDVWTYCKPSAAKKYSEALLKFESELFDDAVDLQNFVDICHVPDHAVSTPWQHTLWDYFFKKAGIWGVGENYINFAGKHRIWSTIAHWNIIRPGNLIKIK